MKKLNEKEVLQRFAIGDSFVGLDLRGLNLHRAVMPGADFYLR